MVNGIDRVGKYVSASDASKRYYYHEINTEQYQFAVNKCLTNNSLRVASVKVPLSDLNTDRSIFLYDYVNEDNEDSWNIAFDLSSAQRFTKSILDFDAESHDPINIYINSNGGYVQSVYAMVSVLKGVKSTVRTICLGNAESCGAVLLAAGNERYVGKHSSVMIHDLSSSTWGSLSEMESQLEEMKRINSELIDIMVEKSCQDKAIFTELMKSDFFMNSEEAADLGLVDGILDIEETIKDLGMSNKLRNHAGMASGRMLEGKLISKLESKIKSKGVPFMSRETMIADLNEKHGIDVLTMQSKLKMTEESLAEAVKAQHEAEKRAKEAEESQILAEKQAEAEKEAADDAAIETALDQLVKDCKSTQDMNNDVYRPLFKMKGILEAKKLIEKLPVIVKTNASANTTAITASSKSEAEEKVWSHCDEKKLARTSANFVTAFNELKKEGVL